MHIFNKKNEITKDKRDNKKAHYSSYFDQNKQKSSEIWQGIRSLVDIKVSESIKLLDENNNLVSDPKIISNVFNYFFSTIGPEIERNIPFVQVSFKDYFNKREKNGKLLINSSNSSFLHLQFQVKLEKIIDALDINKNTSGPNSIPVFILKSIEPFWLSQLINPSFKVGIFPDILKTAKIIPLHKKDCKLNFRNYRPISPLSAFSKIFEKVM